MMVAPEGSTGAILACLQHGPNLQMRVRSNQRDPHALSGCLLPEELGLGPQADDLVAKSEAAEMQLRNELADQAGLLATTKRKLALLNQSQGQPGAQLQKQRSISRPPEGSGDLQKALDRRGEELELERATSILLHRCLLPLLAVSPSFALTRRTCGQCWDATVEACRTRQ